MEDNIRPLLQLFKCQVILFVWTPKKRFWPYAVPTHRRAHRLLLKRLAFRGNVYGRF